MAGQVCQVSAATIEAMTWQFEHQEHHDEPDEQGGFLNWRWVAAIAGSVLVIAIVATVVILGSDDDGSTSAQVVGSSSPPPAAATSTSPAPETLTRSPATTTSSAEPAPSSTEAAPPEPQVTQRTITYTVTGSRPSWDIVTIAYTDETGALRTDFNVTLPWTKTLSTDGEGLLTSVTATSVAGQLSCAITDGNGQTVASQNLNTIAATCNN